MKKAIAILALGLPLAMAETEHDFDRRHYGNWTAITGKPDPFDPAPWAKAYNAAKANSNNTDLVISVECRFYKYAAPTDALVSGPHFRAAYTNFQDTELGNGIIYAQIAVLFDGGKPRRIKVFHNPGGNSWNIDNSTDITWMRNSLLEKDRLYVRWDEFGTGQVTAEFDLTGATDAFTDIEGRCGREAAPEG